MKHKEERGIKKEIKKEELMKGTKNQK